MFLLLLRPTVVHVVWSQFMGWPKKVELCFKILDTLHETLIALIHICKLSLESGGRELQKQKMIFKVGESK